MDNKNENTLPETENTFKSFGLWLKGLREAKKISLEEVAAVTKIHIQQLQLIENGEHEKFPQPAFVRGFLVNYAKHIGADADEVLTRYREVGGESFFGKNMSPHPEGIRAAKPKSHSKVKIVTGSPIDVAPSAKDLEAEEKPKINFKWVSIIIVLALIIGGLAYIVQLGKKQSDEKSIGEAPQSSESEDPISPETSKEPITPPVITPQTQVSVSPETTTQSSPQTSTVAVVKAETKNPSSNGPVQVQIRALEQSWINVRSDNGSSQGTLMVGGKFYTFSGKDSVRLSLSNAGGVEIAVNGVWYESPGFRGDVKQLNLPEDIKNLKPRGSPAPVKPKGPAQPKPDQSAIPPN